MTYQTAGNILVAIRAETTTGVEATVTGAQQMRIIGSPGLELKRAQIQSTEKRDDGLRSMGRLGGKSVDGSYNAEITVGGATDTLLEAIMRSTWATATAISFASVTTITCGSNEVVGAGDWVAQGIRVGDIFTLSNYSTAANNAVNARVVAITSGTLSVPAATFTAGAADAAGTLTVLKKVKHATTPTRRTFTVEQYDQDTDLSEIFIGCRVVGVNLSFRPGQMATVQYTFMGLDRDALATGTSPYFTSPTLTTGLGLIADDSSIRKNGADITTFTGFDLNFQITAAGEPVIGSFVSPDIFDNDCDITGTITGLRSDFANLTLFDAETEFEVSILLQEPSGSPKGCLAIFLPRVKIAQLSAPVGGGDGAKIETLGLMVGPKTAATGYDGTAATISSSAS
jgi:hypothetical protein